LAEDDIEMLIQSSLRHVLLYKPSSQDAVFSVVESIEDTLLGDEDKLKHIQSRPLAGIAVDSVSSFHWQNRAFSSTIVQASMAIEERHLSSSAQERQKVDNVLTTLTSKLLGLSQTFSCFVVVTSWITANISFTINATGTSWPVVPGFQHRFPGL